MTKRRHAAGNGVSQTVRMIDIIYAAAATAVANLNSLALYFSLFVSCRNFIVLTFLWILIRLLWKWAGGVAVNLLRQTAQTARITVNCS